MPADQESVAAFVAAMARQRVRERVQAQEAAHDAKVAERNVNQAEADALDAVSFAEAAIEEAHYAVLDAILARRAATVMEAAKP